MSGDADTVREALEHMTYNGPVARAAKAALARLEACEAQRDALAKALLIVRRYARDVDVRAALVQGGVDIDAALAEAATREETS